MRMPWIWTVNLDSLIILHLYQVSIACFILFITMKFWLNLVDWSVSAAIREITLWHGHRLTSERKWKVFVLLLPHAFLFILPGKSTLGWTKVFTLEKTLSSVKMCLSVLISIAKLIFVINFLFSSNTSSTPIKSYEKVCCLGFFYGPSRTYI